MQLLIACAKLMDPAPAVPDGLSLSRPYFETESEALALDMCGYGVDQLTEMLGVNREIAIEVRRRYDSFFDPAVRVPAVFSYDGIVFKKIDPHTLDLSAIDFAQNHLNICSFLYGLLRPLDNIAPYRLEGHIELVSTGFSTIFDYWKPLLTERLIHKVREDDGILINLASNEMQKLFDWKRIHRELTVISPAFKVEKNGRLSNVTVYAKMCSGAMTRHILRHKCSVPADLLSFEYEGFRYSGSSASDPLFVLKE